ncbi:MAG: hypothetical protein M3415_09590 [Actinomycetota bacterium]|nr:hypothetical protein [Actinomycetota bacterium]
MANRQLLILGSDETVELDACARKELAGAVVYRSPDGRWLLPAFRSHAVDIGDSPLPSDDDEDGLAALVLEWVRVVGGHDWSPLGGAQLEGDEDWVDLRTAMVRVGWGPLAAQAAWDACRARPYSRNLPTAAGWAGAGWVVPAGAGDVDPAFARPVLEARGLLRWAYIGRWADAVRLPDTALPDGIEPGDLGGIEGGGPSWADTLSRLRQDHYPDTALVEAEQLAIQILVRAGLGPRSVLEAEDEPLADRDLVPACTHASSLVRAAAWFLLRDEAEAWLACGYAECQHHWAVEAEEDAYEMEEVLELAGYGVVNPVDAAYTRRRLLTMAFGDINDVALAGAGDVADFIAFYTEWVAHGRPEDDFAAAAAELRGD